MAVFVSSLLFISYLSTVLSADIALTQMPLYHEAGACLKSCASSISTEYSNSIGCPTEDPAACICTLGPRSEMATAAEVCNYANCLLGPTKQDNYSAALVITQYCDLNGFTIPTVIPNPSTLGMFFV